MKRLSTLVLFLILVLLIVGAGLYFKNSLFSFYTKNLENFEKGDFGTVLNQITEQIFAPTPLNVGGAANNVVLVKLKIIEQTNIQRHNNGGLPPLTENTKLDEAAAAKANDMFKNQYFEHISPTGVGPGDLVKVYGYQYVVSGENLILGNFKDEAEVVQLWMNSPGHRANILNNRYTEIGVAIVKGIYEGKTAWIGVQEFGLPLSACPYPDTVIKSQIDENTATLNQLSLTLEEKKNEIEKTNRRSPEYNALVDEYNALVDQFNALNQSNKQLVVQYNSQVNTFNTCVAPEPE